MGAHAFHTNKYISITIKAYTMLFDQQQQQKKKQNNQGKQILYSKLSSLKSCPRTRRIQFSWVTAFWFFMPFFKSDI